MSSYTMGEAGSNARTGSKRKLPELAPLPAPGSLGPQPQQADPLGGAGQQQPVATGTAQAGSAPGAQASGVQRAQEQQQLGQLGSEGVQRQEGARGAYAGDPTAQAGAPPVVTGGATVDSVLPYQQEGRGWGADRQQAQGGPASGKAGVGDAYDPLARQGQPPSWDETREVWADTMAQYAQGLNDQLAGINADESSNAARAANMAAGMSSGVGGAYQSGQIQAQLSGTVERSRARAEHNLRGLEMRMAYLDKMYEAAERRADRETMERIAQEKNALDAQISQATIEMQRDIHGAQSPDPDAERMARTGEGSGMLPNPNQNPGGESGPQHMWSGMSLDDIANMAPNGAGGNDVGGLNFGAVDSQLAVQSAKIEAEKARQHGLSSQEIENLAKYIAAYHIQTGKALSFDAALRELGYSI